MHTLISQHGRGRRRFLELLLGELTLLGVRHRFLRCLRATMS